MRVRGEIDLACKVKHESKKSRRVVKESLTRLERSCKGLGREEEESSAHARAEGGNVADVPVSAQAGCWGSQRWQRPAQLVPQGREGGHWRLQWATQGSPGQRSVLFIVRDRIHVNVFHTDGLHNLSETSFINHSQSRAACRRVLSSSAYDETSRCILWRSPVRAVITDLSQKMPRLCLLLPPLPQVQACIHPDPTPHPGRPSVEHFTSPGLTRPRRLYRVSILSMTHLSKVSNPSSTPGPFSQPIITASIHILS